MATVRIKADLAGAVSAIVVAVGAQVAEDEPLILLESMKMEIPVLAPRGGRVTSIQAAVGDLVAEGDVLAILET